MCLHYSAQEVGTFTSGGAEMFTCGALGCLPTVFRPRGAVFTCGADIYLRCYRMFTSGGAEIFMPDGMGVYTSGGFAYTRRE